MWRLFNKLFGWHYIWLEDVSEHKIIRVTELPDGRLMGKYLYRNVFISVDGKITGGYLASNWVPLTWEFKPK